jgi:magnesium chelatase subunit I
VRAAAAEFVLEGLYAHRRIARSETNEYQAGEHRRERDHPAADEAAEDPRSRKARRQSYQ